MGRRTEEGSALVEFAIAVPVLFTLLLGMISAGTTYNRKIQMTGATREAARIAAAIPSNQAFLGGLTWAQAVTEVAKERVGSDLGTSYTVCVSLVEGTGPSGATATAVISPPAGHTASEYNLRTVSVNSSVSTSNPGPCVPSETYAPYNASSDKGRRVQVLVSRPSQIQSILFTMSLTLSASATAKSESTS